MTKVYLVHMEMSSCTGDTLDYVIFASLNETAAEMEATRMRFGTSPGEEGDPHYRVSSMEMDKPCGLTDEKNDVVIANPLPSIPLDVDDFFPSYDGRSGAVLDKKDPIIDYSNEMERVIKTSKEFDERVEMWHDDWTTKLSLKEYLNMSDGEYAWWVQLGK